MTSKHKQARLRQWSTPVILIAVMVVFVLLVSIFGDKSLARMAAQTMVRVTFVVGLWIFVGNSGVVSFGHAAFAAIGAYCSAWLTLKPTMKNLLLPDLWPFLAQAEWPVFPAAIASGLLAATVALLAGLAILRLSGIAASIATFAFLAMVNTIYSSWEGVTGATSSVVGLSRYADQWVTLGWAAAAVIAAAIYANSSSGLALKATREDEVAAAASGVNMYRHRLLSLVVSAFFTGVAGALLGHTLGVLNPGSFYLDLTFITLAMLVIGGISALSGAVVGVLTLSIVIEFLVRLESGVSVGSLSVSLPAGTQELLIGTLMILVLILRSGGLTNGREFQFGRRSSRAKTQSNNHNQLTTGESS